MSGERHTEPLDVHLILRRDTGEGPEVLLSRLAGAVYAAGLWHLPSVHLDGPEEDVVAALVRERETREETGVGVDLVDVRADGRLQVDVRKQDASGAFAYLREEVHDRLMQDQALLPGGMAPTRSRAPTNCIWARPPEPASVHGPEPAVVRTDTSRTTSPPTFGKELLCKR